MDPFTLSAVYSAGAGDAAEAGGAAAMSNPITAAIAAAALATAYGVSPTVRHKVNPMIKSGYEGITNPFQHFGDGSSKDKFGNMFHQIGSFGQMDPLEPGQLDPGMSAPHMQPSLDNSLQQALKNLGQGQGQQKQQNQQTSSGSGGISDGVTAPNSIPYINTSYQYAPPSPLNPIPPLFMAGGKYGGAV